MIPENPFVGLRPFKTNEALIFFGREEQTTELLERLHYHRFVAVIGSSGCGKSSLIYAGLIPNLKAGMIAGDRDRWFISTMKPGDDPWRRLVSLLLNTFPETKNQYDVESLGKVLFESEDSAIVEVFGPILNRENANLLLLVDQFEEIFRYEKKNSEYTEEKADFVSLMLSMAQQQTLPIYVVITMRSDFIGDCDRFPGLPEAINKSMYLVPRLTRKQLREAIENPVRLYGQEVKSQLLNRLLYDTGNESDQLPVLQHVLMRTWENWKKANEDDPLDIKNYEAVGTIHEALTLDANGALSGMTDDELILTEQIFQRLTDTDSSNRQVRRPAYLSDIEDVTKANQERIKNIIRRFQAQGRNFIFVSEEEQKDDSLIDISHESLVRKWDTLTGWVNKEAESRSMYLRLIESAIRYKEDKEKEGLWQDPRLQTALKWREEFQPSQAWAQRYNELIEKQNKTAKSHKEQNGGYYGLAMKFLDDSEKKRERKRRFRNLIMAIGVVFVVIAIAAVGSALWQNRLAGQQSRIAEARRLYTLSIDVRRTEPGLLNISALLAAEALQNEHLRESEQTTRASLSLLPFSTKKIDCKNSMSAIQFTSDGKYLAAVSSDKIVLWDVENWQEKSSVDHRGYSDKNVIAFSADGKYLATAIADKGNTAVQVWDISANREGLRVPCKNEINTFSLSSDGKYLAIANRDANHNSKIQIWDVIKEEEFSSIPLEKYVEIPAVSISADGRYLATVSGIYVLIWDLQREKEPLILSHRDAVNAVVFNSDSTYVATASEDRTARVWMVGNDREFSLMSHEGNVYAIAFSSDGEYLATASEDNTTRVWEWFKETEVLRIPHEKTVKVNAISISPDGRYVATACDNNTISIWGMTGDGQYWRLARGGQVWELTDEGREYHKGDVRAVSFNPDGEYLATASDKSIGLWEETDGNWEAVWKIPREGFEYTKAISFSPDGKYLAITCEKESANGKKSITVQVHKVGTNEKPIEIGEYKDKIYVVSFSPDGKYLAAAGAKGSKVQVWDAKNWQEVLDLDHGDNVYDLSFSPDGKYLATAGKDNKDNTVRVWNMKDRREVPKRVCEGLIYAVSFSPDSKYLATASADNTARIWSTRDWQEVSRLIHEGDVNDLSFSPDGKYIATVSADNTATIWDTRYWLEVSRLVHEDVIYAVSFSPDGKYLATTTMNGIAHIWLLDPEDLIQAIYKRVGRGLTEDECKEFLPGKKYREIYLENPVDSGD